ncbi:BTB/POZ protein [Rhizophagus irregularis DAOM 181602=DAOM 197198]|nr:BTB/POZ protein [Rhizophagus irregularis DAOM 181602=DAOM 197198]
MVHIKLSNISSEIFQIILEYIYGGILPLNVNDTSDFLKVLVAADNLHLQELVDYLQEYLIEKKPEWIEHHFEFAQHISSQSNNLLELHEFCTNLMAQFPDKVFNSIDFISLSEKSLISLIKREDLQTKEVEIWEHVLKWGLAKNPNLIPDPKTWEFSQKVRPYQKLLGQRLYEELSNSHLDPVEETGEILGGYNPLEWESSDLWTQTKDSFIFSFKNMDINDAILSNVKNANCALDNSIKCGPQFGYDLNINSYKNLDLDDVSTDFNVTYCSKEHYEKRIRDTEADFPIGDYELISQALLRALSILISLLMKLMTSSNDMRSQIPSRAKTKKSVSVSTLRNMIISVIKRTDTL